VLNPSTMSWVVMIVFVSLGEVFGELGSIEGGLFWLVGDPRKDLYH
jgi:hypothetical protein